MRLIRMFNYFKKYLLIVIFLSTVPSVLAMEENKKFEEEEQVPMTQKLINHLKKDGAPPREARFQDSELNETEALIYSLQYGAYNPIKGWAGEPLETLFSKIFGFLKRQFS